MACDRGCCPSNLDHYRSLGFVSTGSTVKNQRDRRLAKDLAAYQRIRRNGIQPKQIDGSAELEVRANNRLEVEMGHLFPTKDAWSKAKEGMARAEEIKEAIKMERIEAAKAARGVPSGA